MKNLLLLFFVPIFSFGQYSNYYNVNVSGAIDVKKNINISGNINKTITTIDYGALAEANAKRQRNAIELMKFESKREKEILTQIADDPRKALYYGEKHQKTYNKNRGFANLDDFYGIKKFSAISIIPHESLFKIVGLYAYENVDDNFITTNIDFWPPMKIESIKSNKIKKMMETDFDGIFDDLEKFCKFSESIVGKKKDSKFLHKKELNRAKVFTRSGFKTSFALEDDYEITLKDVYITTYDGLIFVCKVNYTADKDDATFEVLEGRRHYLRQMIEVLISTTHYYDIKY